MEYQDFFKQKTWRDMEAYCPHDPNFNRDLLPLRGWHDLVMIENLNNVEFHKVLRHLFFDLIENNCAFARCRGGHHRSASAVDIVGEWARRHLYGDIVVFHATCDFEASGPQVFDDHWAQIEQYMSGAQLTRFVQTRLVRPHFNGSTYEPPAVIGLHLCRHLSQEASLSLRDVHFVCARLGLARSLHPAGTSSGEAVSQCVSQACIETSSKMNHVACFKQMLAASNRGKLDLSELQRHVIIDFIADVDDRHVTLAQYEAELPVDKALAMTQLIAMEVVWRTQPHETMSRYNQMRYGSDDHLEHGRGHNFFPRILMSFA